VIPSQRILIERARELVLADDRIVAAWLAGSFGTGRADAYSDVDLHLLLAAGADFSWCDLGGELAPAVLCAPILA
jgi:predicted nucleotidyltransferase